MHSELHDRLEYLVNYSSQLIFVSSDSVAQQQKTMEAFVFKQPNETEIAYITASPKMDIADYRCQLCRQLLGQTVGSYVRPLNELLASLNNHDGPILITITQAQHIPDPLLQELWNLVLQSRFAGNKQHLNVLVFGETQWAERAKQWLPAKNTTTPLLISSQSVLSTNNELTVDKLIAQRRQEFEKHLAARYAPTTAHSDRRNPAIFWTLIALVFLAVFGTFISWLYNDKITALFQPVQTVEKSTPGDDIEVGSAFDELVNEQVDAPPKDVSLTKSANTEPALEEVVSATKEKETELVANWPDALSSIDSNAELTGQSNTNEPVERSDNNQPTQTPDDSKQVAKRQIDTSAVTPQTSLPVQSDETSITPLSAENVQEGHYYIQLSGLKDGKLLAQFVEDHDLAAVVNMYQTQRYGGDWFVLLFHQSFA